jgi:hypothetical protein
VKLFARFLQRGGYRITLNLAQARINAVIHWQQRAPLALELRHPFFSNCRVSPRDLSLGI